MSHQKRTYKKRVVWNLESYNVHIAPHGLSCNEYLGVHKEVEHMCVVGHTFKRRPVSILRGHHECPSCGDRVLDRTLASHNIEIAKLPFKCIEFKRGRANNLYQCKTCKAKFEKVTQALLDGRSLECETCKSDAVKQATLKHGYNFSLLVMSEKGNRIKLPKDWRSLSRQKLECMLRG